MSKEYSKYLLHILDECSYILSVTANLSASDFQNDETLKRAIVRSFEIIGEATRNIPKDARIKWSSIAWKEMAGMRNRLIHGCIGVDYKIVWTIVKGNIPELSNKIKDILQENNNFSD